MPGAPSRRAVLAAASLAAVPAQALAGARISERIVGAGPLRLRLRLAAPLGSPPPGGYPLLVVLDADPWFEVAAAIAEARVEEAGPMVIAGVGYPGGRAFDPQRVRDLTPFAPQTPLDGPQTGVEVGGGEAFAAALLDRLLPLAVRQAPIAAGRRAIFGHSLGGLFVLNLLLTRPGAFDLFVAASPSIWWHKPRLTAEAEAFAPSARPACALITAGELEDVMGPADAAYIRQTYAADPKAYGGVTVEAALEAARIKMAGLRMTANAREMALLVSRRGLPTPFVEFPGESHMSAGPAAINRAVSLLGALA